MRSFNGPKRYLITGTILLSIVAAFFLIGLFWTPYGINSTDSASKLMAPCAEHIFGTDGNGMDALHRS